MAMNKAEKAAMEQLEIRAALCWSEPVAHDVQQPLFFSVANQYVEGWFASPGGRVSKGWSGIHSHGDGEPPSSYHHQSSQGGRPLYSTRLLALKAVRYARARDMAKELMQLDRMIAAEAGL